jgi:hypothetical protein
MASFSFEHKDYHSKTDKKIMKFVYDLMSKYKQMESESTNEYIYSCHNEFDSNVSEFEGLSNGNYIVVKTKLNPIHMPIIMRMFQSIYDDSYWPYEDLENECYSCDGYLSDLYEDYPDDEFEVDDIPEKYRELRQKLLNYDVDEWFKLLTSYSEKNHKLEHNKSEDIDYVDEEWIFHEPPKKSYYDEDQYEDEDEDDEEDENETNKLYTQKFYTLDNIMEMLENDMKTTLRKASRNLA